MDVKFFRATDAFLYLPTYIAEHRGIYDVIDPMLNVTFQTPDAPNSSDQSALFAMLEESRKSGDTVPVAVCDPFIMFRSHLDDFNMAPENLRVIGSLITKVPFWGVDKVKETIQEEDLGKNFDRVAYYNEKLLTGHYIGMRTQRVGKIKDSEIVYFGEEFDYLFDDPKKRTIAITSDIISMALYSEHQDPSKRTSINYTYAKNAYYKNFITTALVTTSEVCDRYPDALKKVMEGIQRALIILQSSRKIAHSVCKQLASRKEFYHPHQLAMISSPNLSTTQIDFMLDCIYDGKFYPQSLDITETQWTETLDKHARGLGEYRDEFEKGKALYHPIVDNRFLIGGQRQLLIGSGIDIDMLAESEITSRVETTLAKERIMPRNLLTDVRVASRLSFGLATAGALTMCFFPSLNFLYLRLVTMALAAFFPLSVLSAWLRRRVSFLNSHAILWLVSLSLLGVSGWLLHAAVKSTQDSAKFGLMAFLCGLTASAGFTALFTTIQLWLQSRDGKR